MLMDHGIKFRVVREYVSVQGLRMVTEARQGDGLSELAEPTDDSDLDYLDRVIVENAPADRVQELMNQNGLSRPPGGRKG